MKKLMLLGGSRYAIPVIRAAHELGIYVITCDYLPDNIAHKYSDEYINVSITDIEATLESARSHKIDGIMSFACDPGVITAAYIAEQLGLPTVGKYESVCILQNKGLFRDFLRTHGFNVPMAKSYRYIDEAMEDLSYFHWPVIVKPTDSAGSKGVTRLDNPDGLRKSIAYALKYSRAGEFIIEDFIAQKGFSSDSDCFSVDGKLKFVSFNSQRFDSKAMNPYTPSAYSWPSTISYENQIELKNEIQRLLSLLDLGTSIYNIETREDLDGKPYIMECSPRGGGNRLAECLEYATGVDLIKNSVRAAIGMQIERIEQRPYNGYWAEIVLHGTRPGIFDGLVINKSVKEYVYEEDIWVSKGTMIGGFSAANESIGTLVLRADQQMDLESIMCNIDDYVRVMVR